MLNLASFRGAQQLSYPSDLAASLLQKGIEVGDVIKVVRDDGLVVEGILMPRPKGGRYIVVKLKNGYNVGIDVRRIKELELVAKRKPQRREKGEKPPRRPGYPLVKVLGTGGTIASRIDYETGAVKPAMSTEELVEEVPELLDYADVEAEQIMDVLSENMTPEMWSRVAEAVHAELLREEVAGVVVAHGTDTMVYTASAVAFAIREINKPVVFVGAQRSSDRPSSDATLNLIGATIAAARSDIAESIIAMHGESSDTFVVLHRATRTKKFHSTRRDAFQSICAQPLAYVWPWTGDVEPKSRPLRTRGDWTPKLMNSFEPRVLQLRAYPGMPPDLLYLAKDKGFKGVIIEGTGMGHVPEYLVDAIKELTESGIFVGVTTQCVHGTTNLNVYATGRKMLEAGATPLGDMLTEVATVKLMWALANYPPEEVPKVMVTPLEGELRERRLLRDYRLSYRR
ncbi:TPA: Glu-tRNA(Gln) amidotransferase subunit GatD [Desulfurococcaceae archaeon]|nr:Glu-tRNA(Gln) amidotransferase subunit GatD [Desulfurococcaceae archaeon]